MDQGVARSTVENVLKQMIFSDQHFCIPDPEEPFVGIYDFGQTAEPELNSIIISAVVSEVAHRILPIPLSKNHNLMISFVTP